MIIYKFVIVELKENILKSFFTKMANLSEMAENCSALENGFAPTIEFYVEV